MKKKKIRSTCSTRIHQPLLEMSCPELNEKFSLHAAQFQMHDSKNFYSPKTSGSKTSQPLFLHGKPAYRMKSIFTSWSINEAHGRGLTGEHGAWSKISFKNFAWVEWKNVEEEDNGFGVEKARSQDRISPTICVKIYLKTSKLHLHFDCWSVRWFKNSARISATEFTIYVSTVTCLGS